MLDLVLRVSVGLHHQGFPLLPQGAVPDPMEIIRTGKGHAGGGGRVGELIINYRNGVDDH